MRKIIDNFEIHAKQWLVNSYIYDSSARSKNSTPKNDWNYSSIKNPIFLYCQSFNNGLTLRVSHISPKNRRENKQTCTSAISTWIKIENENLYHIWILDGFIYTWVKGKIKEGKKKLNFPEQS